MIVGSIKLDDSEIAIGEVPLTFIVDADQWLLQGQASCSVRSSDVLIVLPRDNSNVAGFDGQSRAVNVLGLKALPVKGCQDEVSFPVTSEPSTTRFELAICEDGEEVSGLGPAYASLENRQATVRLRKSEVRFGRQNP